MATGLVAALLCAGCSSASRRAVVTPTTSTSTTTSSTSSTTSTSTSTTSTVAPTTTTAAAGFSDSLAPVSAADLPHTWRPGCPVAPSQLVMITMSYWGFDGRPHTGRMVVNRSVSAQVVSVFAALYRQRFPIREMVPEDAYDGNDDDAAAADDTSGFNCRNAVAPGPPQWSVHAFGEAIDVNDVENPYVDGSTIIPPAGRAFLDRSDVRPGMAVPGGVLVSAFASVGWQWGGRWSPGTDYQHFSLTGG